MLTAKSRHLPAWSIFLTGISLLLCLPAQAARQGGYFESGDTRLYYESAGKGETILLLQGGPGYPSELIARLADSLSDRYHTVIFDSRGTGRSKLPVLSPDTVNLGLMVEDIEVLRRHLGVEQWMVIGYSWGATYAMLYADRHPEAIQRLALCASGGIDLTVYNRNEQTIPAYRQPAFINDPLLHTASAFVHKPRSVAPAARLIFGDPATGNGRGFMPVVRDLVVSDLFRIKYDLTEKFHGFRAPVLIIQGQEDFTGIDVAEKTRAAFPHARLELLPDCGHLMALDQPELFAAKLGAFLAE